MTRDTAQTVPSGLIVWCLAARPKTLPAAIVPVAVGTVLAARMADWAAWPAFLCLVFALLIQVGTNFTNDWSDFEKGADTGGRIGPARAVAAGWVSPATMRRAAFLVFAAAFLAGLNLVLYGGWWLVVVGLAAILSGVAYTAGPWPLGYNGLGDLFVLVFFGWVAVGFTFFVQTGFFAGEVWLAGTGAGALAVAILLVNNYRDRGTDRLAGKRTLVVRWGETYARIQFAACHVAALLVPVTFLAREWGAAVLLPWILVPLAVHLNRRLAEASDGEDFNRLLELSGLYLMAWGVLFCTGLWLG